VKILVPVKRVPDPETKIKLAPDGSGIVTDGVKYVVNPFDEIAVEEALQIQKQHGGEVVIVSIGAAEVVEQNRTALAMGADRGIRIDADAQLDSFSVARLLHAVVQDESPDLVLMGKQAIDDDANQAAQILATLMDAPQACFAYTVEVDDGGATVQREVDGGLEKVKVAFPAVITTDLRLNEPRYASLPGIMKAKRKEVKEVTPDDLGIEIDAKTEILSYEAPPARGGTKILEDVDQLIDVLRNEAKVF